MNPLIKRIGIEMPLIVPGRFEKPQARRRLFSQFLIKRRGRPIQGLYIRITFRVERWIVLKRAVIGEIVRSVVGPLERPCLYQQDYPGEPDYNRRLPTGPHNPAAERTQSDSKYQKKKRQ